MKGKNIVQTSNDTVIAIITTVSNKRVKKAKRIKVSATKKRKKADTASPVRVSEAVRRRKVQNKGHNNKRRRRFLSVS